MKHLKVLFIGNSHTYVNDMPKLMADLARAEGVDCEVTMIAHGGWFLAHHVQEPDVRFNILFGHYDYVVLQEHTHPFAPEEKYLTAVEAINAWISEAGAKPVIYATWAQKTEPEKQPAMDPLQQQAASSINALYAPVGHEWWAHIAANPDVEMYYKDGQHTSPVGAAFAAQVIWRTIREDWEGRGC